MKLTPEEYILILENRGELQLSDEEKELVRQYRLVKRSAWSTYIHYIKPLKDSENVEIKNVATRVYDLSIRLKAGDIEIDDYENLVRYIHLSVDNQLQYIVSQIIKLYRGEAEPELGIDIEL